MDTWTPVLFKECKILLLLCFWYLDWPVWSALSWILCPLSSSLGFPLHGCYLCRIRFWHPASGQHHIPLLTICIFPSSCLVSNAPFRPPWLPQLPTILSTKSHLGLPAKSNVVVGLNFLREGKWKGEERGRGKEQILCLKITNDSSTMSNTMVTAFFICFGFVSRITVSYKVKWIVL